MQVAAELVDEKMPPHPIKMWPAGVDADPKTFATRTPDDGDRAKENEVRAASAEFASAFADMTLVLKRYGLARSRLHNACIPYAGNMGDLSGPLEERLKKLRDLPSAAQVDSRARVGR